MKKFPLLVGILSIFLFSLSWGQASLAAPKYDIPENHQVSVFEQQVAELVNQERKERGLKPLTLHVDLSYVARKKSEDMRDHDYTEHHSPTYGSPKQMVADFGIKESYRGENIAYGYQTPEKVMESWMNSEGHRKNILNPSSTHIGVGYVDGGSWGHYWTQLFVEDTE